MAGGPAGSRPSAHRRARSRSEAAARTPERVCPQHPRQCGRPGARSDIDGRRSEAGGRPAAGARDRGSRASFAGSADGWPNAAARRVVVDRARSATRPARHAGQLGAARAASWRCGPTVRPAAASNSGQSRCAEARHRCFWRSSRSRPGDPWRHSDARARARPNARRRPTRRGMDRRPRASWGTEPEQCRASGGRGLGTRPGAASGSRCAGAAPTQSSSVVARRPAMAVMADSIARPTSPARYARRARRAARVRSALGCERGMRCTAGNAKILATTYVPERLPSQYLRRWRA